MKNSLTIDNRDKDEIIAVLEARVEALLNRNHELIQEIRELKEDLSCVIDRCAE